MRTRDELYGCRECAVERPSGLLRVNPFGYTVWGLLGAKVRRPAPETGTGRGEEWESA